MKYTLLTIAFLVSCSIFGNSDSFHSTMDSDLETLLSDKQINIKTGSDNEYLIITVGENVEATVSILNLYGSEELRMHFTEKIIVELEDFNDGIYFVKVDSDYEKLLKKIIIKK